MIPHRRGEDGYVLAVVTPPDEAAAWQRDLVADGEPLELVVLADTSGSMDDAARANQDAFLAALLGSLGEGDNFQLATCDSEVRWFEVEKFAGSDEEYVGLARDFVAARTSLGWSDLDAAFASVLDVLGEKPNTHVIYIGDGVVTTGDADPVAFGKRLGQRFAERVAELARGLKRKRPRVGNPATSATFHAVAPSSSFESGVLSSVASLGGGSVRKIEGSDTPAEVARQLLAEISAPGLRDMKVEFKGLRTARVYPERLPNIASGKQQILLGRYLPQGEDKAGEVVVTGIRGGKTLSFRAPVALADAESGNSFIPRLWARMHLDALLAQGRTPEIRDEVIALSEEYHIMTPYTSFLVLESDADRERFKVKRRFLMRDGERFFAEGRDNANYELLQKQMRLAGTWRLNLRRSYINELRGLGRTTHFYSQPHPYGHRRQEMRAYYKNGASYGPSGGGFDFGWGQKSREYERSYRDGLEVFAGKDLASAAESAPFGEEEDWDLPPMDPAAPGEPAARSQPAADAFLDPLAEVPQKVISLEGLRKRPSRVDYFHAESATTGASMPTTPTAPMPSINLNAPNSRYTVGFGNEYGELKKELAQSLDGGAGSAPYAWHWRHHMQDLHSLFPAFSGDLPLPGDRSKHPWPKRAIKLADGLLRLDKLNALGGRGVEITLRSSQRDARLGQLKPASSARALLGGEAWTVTSRSHRSDVTTNWLEGGKRGVMTGRSGLGRTMPPPKDAAKRYPSVVGDFSFRSIADQYRSYDAKLAKAQGDEVTLALTHESGGMKSQSVFVIDTERGVVLSHETLRDGERAALVEFSGFVKIAGGWWPTLVRHSDADGIVTGESKFEIRALDEKAFGDALGEALAARGDTIFLDEPQAGVDDAKQLALDGKRSFGSEFALLHHFAGSQQWERADEHFDRLREFAGGKPGFRLLEIRYLAMKRRNEEGRKLIIETARELAAEEGPGEFALAAHLRNEASRLMAAPELHQLLEVLAPIYARMPAHTLAKKEWDTAWMWSLQRTGRHGEMLAKAKANAREYSWDANSQAHYANQLANQGDRPAALAWLKAKIGEEHWTEEQRVSFRSSYVGQLDAENRFEEVRDFLERWFEEQPAPNNAWALQRYAAVLVQLDEVEEAYKLVGRWLAEAGKGKPEQLDPAAAAGLTAALNFLFNNSYSIYRNTIEERFHEPLARIVRRFALSEKHHSYATRIMGDYRFHQTDQVRELRAHYTGVLLKRSGELPFADVQRLVSWAMANAPAVEAETWQKIASPIIDRWAELEDAGERDRWAAVIGNILSARVGADTYTDFLRRQLDESHEEHRGRYALTLFNHLLTRGWSEPVEAEAFDLLYRIAPTGGAGEIERGGKDLLFRASALLRLNDWVAKSGYAALDATIENKEELSRTELAAAQREKREEIREHLAARLARELGERDGLDEGFSHWLNIERLYSEILLGRDPVEIAAECWEFLGKYDPIVADERRTTNEVILITRYLDTLEYLAAKPKTGAALVDRVLKFHQKGIGKSVNTDAWKRRHYRLLVALDRPADLKRALASWIRPEDADSQWRVTLGYLLAELNDIDGAIAQFEAVEAADELRPREYRTLADWYLVRDKREKREGALLGFYDAMPDHQISNLISGRTSQVRQGFENGAPEDLDPEVASMFVALLRKTPHPNNYVGQIAELYRYTKDFRLLECIPEGVIGHSAVQVYPYLQTMAGVHQHIRDEATSDQIFAHLETVRAREKTVIDARGLDLLEMLVRRKASEVLNEPGQHVPAALAAMKRAFARGWEKGERKLMAGFLYHLGRIAQEPLSTEQLREIDILHREEKVDADRTQIGHLRGQLLWSYARRDDALQVLEGVLRDAEDYGGGTLPQSAQPVLSTFVSYLTSQKHYARAERELFRVLDQDVVADMRRWLTDRKFQLYNAALSGGGEVSVGKGGTLYRNIEKLVLADLPQVDHMLRNQLVHRLADTYEIAHNAKIGDAAADLRTFAYGAFDELVPFATSNYQSLVSDLADTLRRMIGYREGLAFLITRYEKEPASFRAQRNGAWRSYGGTIASYRHHSKEGIGDLEPRLLRIVLAELRRELETRQPVRNSIYRHHSTYFWKEKSGDFAKTAEAVLKERYQSDQSAIYIVQYLHDGLGLRDRAIAVLFDLYEKDRLDENARSLLANYLEGAKRWKEAIAVLVPLIEFRPDNIQYRFRLLKSYFHDGQREEQLAVLDAIDGRWHEKGWWNEGTLNSVAHTCYTTQLWGRAVEYYDELIPLHQRSQPNRGIGNGTLSSYFTYLAHCHRSLGDTPAAVEAASGAIVSWGRGHKNRGSALKTLEQVLRESKDLDGYIALLDKEVEETGLENPIVRKAIGRVLLGKPDGADAAIRHLKLAVENQPGDEETHRALVSAYDKKGEAEQAIAALLDAAKLNRRNVAFFKDLGERYEKLQRGGEAERARTNIVEALPNESEGHAMLAGIRQKQDRWEEAAGHWEQVSIIRELEPTGLQRLADAQIKLGRDSEAIASLEKLLAKDWPSRFGKVHRDARNKLAQLEKKAG